MSVSITEFGAVADGITDNHNAIQAAIAEQAQYGGGYVEVPPGIFASTPGLTLAPNVQLVGAARDACVLKMLGQMTTNFLEFQGANGAGLKSLTLDGNGIPTPATFNYSLVDVPNCNDFLCEDVRIINWDRFAIGLGNTNRARITKCLITRSWTSSNQNEAILASGSNFLLSILDNILVNSGMNLCMTGDILHNTINAFGFGGGITLQADTNCYNVNLSYNDICGGVGLDSNKCIPLGIECWAARALVTFNRCHGNAGDGCDIGGQNSTVIGNLCYDNGGPNAPNAAGLVARYGDSTYNASSSLFVANRCYDSRGAKGTQTYGFLIQNLNGLVPTGIKSSGNNYDGNVRAAEFLNLAGTTPGV